MKMGTFTLNARVVESVKLVAPFLAGLLFSSGIVAGQPITLYPGAKAPELTLKRWIKGSQIAALPDKGVAVVEFWATWCGTCRPFYPRLTEIARKRKDVTVLGVGIWEADGPKIDAFVKSMGQKMGFNLAYSGNEDGMAATWMAASGSSGIPTTFIVKDRVIQWIGHPIDLETTLEKVLAGTFSLEKAQEAFRQKLIAAAKGNVLAKAMDDINAQFWAGDAAGAREKLTGFKKSHPNWAGPEILETCWLAKGDPKAFTSAIMKLLGKGFEGKSTAQNAIIRGLRYEAARKSILAAANAIMASGTEDANIVFIAYNVYKPLKDKPGIKASAIRLLELYKQQNKTDSKIQKQLEEDAKRV